MSRIKKEHIVDYIKFLHEYRYNIPAPDSLILKWNEIENDNITFELDKLYSSWNLNGQDILDLEISFLTKKKSNGWLIYLFLIIFIAALIIYSIYTITT
jgi:hypothetical protein